VAGVVVVAIVLPVVPVAPAAEQVFKVQVVHSRVEREYLGKVI
jgi:hypothetical protein